MARQRFRHGVGPWAIGLAVGLLVGCASDGGSPSTAVEVSAPPPVTTTGGTVAPSTTTDSVSGTSETPTSTLSPTTTTTEVAGAFEPACHDAVGERVGAVPSDDPALDTLSIVGDHPALKIELPAVVRASDGPTEPPIAGAARIPGGLLVTVASPSSGWFPGGFVAAVDLDGVVRWVRCVSDGLAGPVVAPLDTEPDRVLLGAWRSDGPTLSYSWDVVSLADGATLGSLDDLVADAGLVGAAASNRQLILAERGVAVFAPAYDHVLDVSTDGLLRLDLATWAVSTTTVPPEFDGHPTGELQIALGSDGSLLRMGQLVDSHLRVPQSVEVDGTWSTDETLRRSVWGPVVDAWYDGWPRLASWDATGSVRWVSDVQFPAARGSCTAARVMSRWPCRADLRMRPTPARTNDWSGSTPTAAASCGRCPAGGSSGRWATASRT